jgi:hypothetical protein
MERKLAVPAVRRVERAAEETDAFHGFKISQSEALS